jgi:hypothetical protein
VLQHLQEQCGCAINQGRLSSQQHLGDMGQAGSSRHLSMRQRQWEERVTGAGVHSRLLVSQGQKHPQRSPCCLKRRQRTCKGAALGQG